MCRQRIDADLALGRDAELVSELEALVQAQPLRERTRAQLMLALYRSGQADALAAYRAARETLVEDLGIDPGPSCVSSRPRSYARTSRCSSRRLRSSGRRCSSGDS